MNGFTGMMMALALSVADGGGDATGEAVQDLAGGMVQALELVVTPDAPNPVVPATLDPRVDRLLRGIEGLRADFVQEVRDESGRLVEISDGRFAMRAPDRFRWHYETPYEQLIVADGTRVWLYDVDLEQVTVRDQDEAAASSPLYVLSRPETLAERYIVTVPETAPDQDLVILEPLTVGADFERVTLRFVADTLAELIIDDAFGQQTAIRFDGVEANPELAAGTFEFTPPAGVDVLGMAELLGDESADPGP